MAKQVKIGFDRVPSPQVVQFVPLYDIATGIPLRDASDQIIVTQIEDTIGGFALSENATSIHINQDKASGAVPVFEVFPLESEVSSTLLGVPRAEEQLSLFSDVSTYGLDDDNWEYFTFNGFRNNPSEWYNRKNPTYGNRGPVEFREGTNEQALYLRAFPVNYTFPYGPGWTRSGNYNPNLFRQYMRFIALGKILYKYYKDLNYDLFAETYFIPDYITIVETGDFVIDPSRLDVQWNQFDGATFIPEGDFYDVKYGSDVSKAFDQIERWTLAYKDILNRSLLEPTGTFYNTDIFQAMLSSTDSVRPGYSGGANYTGILQSRETFRYQPGRISGFTFGIRLRNDTRSNSNFIEFGCTNDTDQYVFQIRGSQFNIVRRSTKKLDEDLLERMDLNSTFQTNNPIYPLGGFAPFPLYETVIPRDRFNGDSLDGNGPSGYIVSFEDVTMFKIEFGWYGAIGAKFYAYVPFDNDGARWVLIHTLVIENGMGVPSLENPNFRFRYLLGATDTQDLREPIYVYKYGASYYIDGGDEGTKKVLSGSSAPKTFIEFTPNIGIFPKTKMMNSFGEEILNRKQVYPTTLSINSTNASRVDVVEINGSPEGHHFHYSPSLHNGINSTTRQARLRVSEDGLTITDFGLSSSNTGGTILTEDDDGKKVIGNGLYNVYYKVDERNSGTDTARVARRTAYVLDESKMESPVSLTDGTVVSPLGTEFDAWIVGHDTIVASDIPLRTDIIKIHFLNPVARDPRFGSRHFADFSIGVTPLKPTLVTSNTGVDVLRFGDDEVELKFGDDELISLEWTHYDENYNIEGVEVSEVDPTYGIRFDLDPRLPRPAGVDSGIISGIVILLSTRDYIVSDISDDFDDLGNPAYRLTFGGAGTGPILSDKDVGKAEIGVDGLATGITILSEVRTNEENREYIIVSDDPSQAIGYNGRVQLRVIELSDNFQVTSYNENGELQFQYKKTQLFRTLQFNIKPLYLVFTLRDYARVNNIIVEEITKETTFTHTPNWITDAQNENVIVYSGGSSLENAPANFVSRDRLSSVRLDTQTQQPLRPGRVIYTVFADGSKTERIDLKNIFNYDRKTIATGLYNNKATFFTATPLAGGGVGDAEVSITIEEQQ